MRKIITLAVILTGTAVGCLTFQAAPVSATSCSPRTDWINTVPWGGNDYGATAWCETGEGYIRGKATCAEEATFRQYTVLGPRVYSKKFFGNYLSTAWCRPNDAAINRGYILG